MLNPRQAEGEAPDISLLIQDDAARRAGALAHMAIETPPMTGDRIIGVVADATFTNVAAKCSAFYQTRETQWRVLVP